MIINSNKEKFIYFFFPTILFSLIPLFLITGPFLSDFAISIIGVLFLAYCYKVKNFSYFNHWYFYLFSIFWIYLIINSLINNFNIDSFKISIFYIRYGIFVLAIVTYLNFDDRFLNYFFLLYIFLFYNFDFRWILSIF